MPDGLKDFIAWRICFDTPSLNPIVENNNFQGLISRTDFNGTLKVSLEFCVLDLGSSFARVATGAGQIDYESYHCDFIFERLMAINARSEGTGTMIGFGGGKPISFYENASFFNGDTIEYRKHLISRYFFNSDPATQPIGVISHLNLSRASVPMRTLTGV